MHTVNLEAFKQLEYSKILHTSARYKIFQTSHMPLVF